MRLSLPRASSARLSTGTHPAKVGGRLASLFVAVSLVVLVFGLELAGADPGGPIPPSVWNIDVGNLIAGVPATVTYEIDDPAATVSCQWQTAGTSTYPGLWTDVSGAVACSGYVPLSIDNGKWHRLVITASNPYGSAAFPSRAYRLGGEVLGTLGCSLATALADGSMSTLPLPGSAAGAYCASLPDLSPEGTMVAFQRQATSGGQQDIWVFDAGGTWARQITNTSGNDETDPRWSPDGSKLAYLRTAAAGARTVLVYDVATGVETSLGEYDFMSGNSNSLDWLDDANLVFYMHARQGGTPGGLRWRYYTGWPGLGTGRTTDSSVICPYSSGGQQCQFITEAWRLPISGGVAVQVTDSVPPVDATEYAALTGYKTSARDPRVSPDGLTLIADNSGNGLMIKTSTSGWTQELTTFSSFGYAWRSDGAKIFWTNFNTTPGVYTVNPDLTGSAAYATGASFAVYDFGFMDPAGHPPIPPTQTFGPAGGGGPAQNPSGSQAEPVNTATGSYWTQVTDVSLPGIGLPFVFKRTYNSADTAAGELGPGWTHAYAASLSFAVNGDATLRWGTGQRVFFRKNADGSFTPPAGGLSTLALTGATYELVLERGQLRYAFDTQGRVTSIKDRNNNTITLAYTGGLLSQITDTVGRQITIQHVGGLISSVAVPDGRHVDFGYTGGRLTSVVDVRGKTWSYEYDAGGRLSKITDPNLHFVVRNTYGADGRVSDQYDARGNHTTFDWDVNTQTATMTDARLKQWQDVYSGNVLWKRIDPLGNTVRLEHDEQLNLVKLVDARGNTTTMSYDAAGNMLTRTAPAPLSYQQTWTYTARNDVETYKDGRNGVTTFGYDTAGNLTQMTHPDPDGGGSLPAPVEQFGRHPSGNGLLASYTDPRQKTWSFQYLNGLLSETLSPLGFKTTFGYDAAGRVSSVVDPRGYAAGNVPADYTADYTYDEAGNRLTVTTPDPDGAGSQPRSVWAAAYDPAGLLDTSTDPEGHLTDYAYDEADHLTQVVPPDPDGTGPLLSPITAYAYNEVGDLGSRTDANLHLTGYGYDDARRLTSVTAPLSRTWSYGYDANGNLTSVTDANGNATPTGGDGVTTFGYDNLDRVSSIDYADATPDVTFGYDANSNRTQMTDGSGQESYALDALDRLTSATRGADVLVFEYDAASNLTRRTYPGAVVLDLAYDNDGRLQSASSGGLATSYAYDEAGNLLQTALPSANGHLEARVYDRAGRLTDVWNKKGTTTLSRFVLTLDKDGNPTQIVRSGAPSETRKYLYDRLDRLTEVCFQAAACTAPNSPFVRWTYDGVGNRLTEARSSGTTSYAYDAADRLLTAGATSYAFDANGNQTAAGSRTFAYDLANRLKSTTLSGTTTSYLYDGDGKRLRASTGAAANQITNYLWDVTTPTVPQLALERDGGGTLLRRYHYGADLISMAAPSSMFYFHHDDLGSVMNMTSATGVKQWTYTYEPYGVMKTETKNKNTAPATVVKFAGEQLDPTGLYYLRARQYDPATGRFGAIDPIAAWPSAESAYAYVSNMPTTLIDPSGLAPEGIDTGGTCGSVWCWIESDEGQTDIACSVFGASLVAGVGEAAISARASVRVLGRLLRGSADNAKRTARLGRFGTAAGVGYATSQTLLGGCSERQLLQHIGIGT